jgi:hypothetical protein
LRFNAAAYKPKAYDVPPVVAEAENAHSKDGIFEMVNFCCCCCCCCVVFVQAAAVAAVIEQSKGLGGSVSCSSSPSVSDTGRVKSTAEIVALLMLDVGGCCGILLFESLHGHKEFQHVTGFVVFEIGLFDNWSFLFCLRFAFLSMSA